MLRHRRAILHDESRYVNADAFNPDRFLTAEGELDPNVPNPEEFAFGFGRRICPGRYLSISSVWLAIASILATFELVMPTDESGKKIEPEVEYTTGLVRYVLCLLRCYGFPLNTVTLSCPATPHHFDVDSSRVRAMRRLSFVHSLRTWVLNGDWQSTVGYPFESTCTQRTY